MSVSWAVSEFPLSLPFFSFSVCFSYSKLRSANRFLLVNLFRSGKVKSSVSQVALKKAKKCPCRGRSASYPHIYPSSRSPSASPTPTRSFPCSFTGECKYLSVMSVDALSVMSVDVVMSVDAVCYLWMLSVMSMDAVWMRSVCDVCGCCM